MGVVPNYDVNDLTRLIASRIRGLMAQHGVKQAELAESINVSQSQLSKMLRGVRPIDLDQLDGMCLALGQQLSAIIAEAESILENLDVVPNARYIFVDDGLRLEKPMDTEGWGTSHVIPIPEGRSPLSVTMPSIEAADVAPVAEDDEADIEVSGEVQSAYDRAAHRGPRKADEPYAE